MPPLAREKRSAAGPIPPSVSSVTVSLEEAAAFLDIPLKHIVELTKVGFLPYLKRGDACFIRFGDVLEYQRERDIRRREESKSPLGKIRDLIYAEGLDRLPVTSYDTP